MNIESEIKFNVPGVVVKATGNFLVGGKLVAPGALAVLSVHEATNVYSRKLATPAEPSDMESAGEIAISGTLDFDTLQTVVKEAPQAIQLSASKTINELLRASVENVRKRSPKASKAELRKRSKPVSFDAPLMPQLRG